MPDILALIPARGGSKGIKRKNLLPLAGKPLLAYSIESALASKLVTRVIVSTEDIEIGRLVGDYGVDVITRPPEFATDESPDIETFTHVLETVKSLWDYRPSLIVHLRPTCPIRKQGDIDKAIQIMLDHPKADSLRSVSKAKQSPYKMWTLALQGMDGVGELTRLYDDDLRELEYEVKRARDNHGKPLMVPYCGEQHSLPRQLLPTVYHQNGYIDVIRASTIERGYMAGDVVLPFIVEPAPLDLDYPEDVAKMEQAILNERGEWQVTHFHSDEILNEIIRHAV